jgi:hypothetical protein
MRPFYSKRKERAIPLGDTFRVSDGDGEDGDE